MVDVEDVADPDRRRQVGSESDSRSVFEVVGRAGLRRHDSVFEVQRAVVAEDLRAVVIVRHDLGHDEGDARVDGLARALVGVRLVQQLTV